MWHRWECEGRQARLTSVGRWCRSPIPGTARTIKGKVPTLQYPPFPAHQNRARPCRGTSEAVGISCLFSINFSSQPRKSVQMFSIRFQPKGTLVATDAVINSRPAGIRYWYRGCHLLLTASLQPPGISTTNHCTFQAGPSSWCAHPGEKSHDGARGVETLKAHNRSR
jgi:hypothetical protein